jgi:hypothetical protein
MHPPHLEQSIAVLTLSLARDPDGRQHITGRVDFTGMALGLALGRRQEAGAVQPVEDRSGKAVAGRPVASVA